MNIKQIVPGVYAIPLGFVNAFLVELDGLTLIDTGLPGSAEKILQAVRDLGKQPTDIRQILITHCHGDHAGSLAALKQATGAPVYMHPTDAAMIREGKTRRPMTPVPGFASIVSQLFARAQSVPATIAAATIDYEVYDGDELPIGGGIKAIHTPGHCAGQLAFLWPHHGGVLFVADNAANVRGWRLNLRYEDLEEGLRSLAKIASLDFEIACFGHGSAIVQGASAQLRQTLRQKWNTRGGEKC